MKRFGALLVLAAAAAALPGVPAQAQGAAPGGRGPGGGPGGPNGGSGLRGRDGRFRSREISLLRLPPKVEARLKLTTDQKAKLEKLSDASRQQMREIMRTVRRPDENERPPSAPGGSARPGPPAAPGSYSSSGPSDSDRRAAMKKLEALRDKSRVDAEALLKPDQKKTWEAIKADAKALSGLGLRAERALLSVEGLTAGEKSKLQMLAADTKKKQDAMSQSGGGTGNPRSGMGDLVQKYQALQKETDSAIRKILTPSHAKLYDAELKATPSFGRGNSGGGRSFRRPGGARPSGAQPAAPRPGA